MAYGDLNRQRMKKRIAQMQFLLKEFTKPVVYVDGMGEMEYDTNGYSPTGITMTIINFMSKSPNGFNYTTVSSFMAKIQSYLPKDLRITTISRQRKDKRESPLWNPRNINNTKPDEIGEETKEYLDQMIDWLYDMKMKCMNSLTFDYLTKGKPQYIEVLKRRYKDEYSEKVEQSVQADVKADNTINIIVEPYEA